MAGSDVWLLLLVEVSSLPALVVRRAGIGSAETDLRIEDGFIVSVNLGLHRAPGEVELDARQGAVLPGLHDHHLHLRALAAARRSVPVGPPQVRDLDGFSAALTAAAAGASPGAWVRAVGYHESVAGDLDRGTLDRIVTDRPLRVQHRSGALWVCNSAGLAAIGAEADTAAGIERDHEGRPTGRLWRMDAWLADRLGSAGAGAGRVGPGGLAQLSVAAAARGVTGWTDATPDRSDAEARALAEAVATGQVRQRLHLMVAPNVDAEVLADVEQVAGVTTGPVKFLLDDTDLPLLDELAALIGRAHLGARPVAVHCVTRVQLVLTLAALEVTGTIPGDRIEHGALIPVELLPSLVRFGLVVVTQPNFVTERGDQYLAEVPPSDQADLWRGRSLVDAGVGVAAGTDAPFGSSDPWLAIRAAIRRRTSSGQIMGAAEAVDDAVALRWWWGSASAPAQPRKLAVGAPGDLVVLDVPLRAALEGDGPVPVAATVIAGEIVTGS